VRRKPAAKVYEKMISAIDRRRRALGWTCLDLDDKAGWQDGYYGKAAHPNSPSGRQAGYYLLDLALDALCPAGYEVLIVPTRPGGRTRRREDPQQLDLFDRAA
jgi:hypothetical protein